MTTPQYYTPRSPALTDTIGYTQKTVDAILRNNPLTDATVGDGLIKWIGNYVDATTGDKVNFLWIGEFLPGDPNLGGVPQRGFSLVRDDSRGGASAIALFDANPGASPGLKQTLFIYSGDGKVLFKEAREGGWRWPEDNVAMGPVGSDAAAWIGTTSATYDTLWEGRVNIVGNQVRYRYFCATTAGATANYRLRIESLSGDVIGPTHALGLTTSAVFEDLVDVSAYRGQTLTIRWEAQCTNGAGVARATVISTRCFSP